MKGDSRSTHMQRLSASMVKDVGPMCPPDVQTMSSMGGFGAKPQHVERDLHRWLEARLGFDIEISYIPLTIKDPKTRRPIVVEYPVIWPHVFASAVHACGPEQWCRTMTGQMGDADFLKFWSHVQSRTGGCRMSQQ